MKKLFALVPALLFVLGLTACDNKSMNYIIGHYPSFTGVVETLYEDGADLYCAELEGYPGGARVHISLSPENGDSYTTPAVGDTLTVYHDGSFMETDPMQIGTLYAITLTAPAKLPAEPPKTTETPSPSAPPSLTVSCGEAHITAMPGTYTLTYANEADGSKTTVCADSAHVTAMEDLPVLSLRYSPLSHTNPFHVLMDFEDMPDEIRLFAWAEDGTALGEIEVAFLCVDAAKDGEPVGGMYGSAVLLEQNAVYEVRALWSDGEEKDRPRSGEVCYGFSARLFPAEE